MNPAEMIVLIVLIVSVAAVLRSLFGHRHNSKGDELQAEQRVPSQLHDDVKRLKERIQVLERIATDRENSLDQEIERLRDR